jgi:NMD protein affecting ribosome stability and mRNA decay
LGEVKRLERHQTREHRHTSLTLHAIRQRSGVPYEIARTVCPECKRVLDEKLLRRAAA